MPRHVDIPYVAGGARGCPGRLTSNEACMGAQTLDIYPATLGGNVGTLVYIHGGGFTNGSKYPMAQLGILKRMTHLGWNVVSIDYRLARDRRFLFPTQIQDVAAALRWLRANGSGYGLNTARLVVAGHSAGGTLAALAGTAGNSGRPEFAGIPPLSGWISIAGILDSTAGELSSYWFSFWLANVQTQGAFASPVTWWDPSDPAGYLAHGDLDTWVEYENVRRMTARTGGSDRIEVDAVDRFSDGGAIPGAWRGHLPSHGMNSTHLEGWLGKLPTLHPFANPFGSLDMAFGQGDLGVVVAGWSIDPDSTLPVAIHLYADNTFIGAVPANQSRADVGAIYPLYGPMHGFRAQLQAPPGVRRICAFAINVGPGNANTLLGCRSATILTEADRRGTPFGTLDQVRMTEPQLATGSGWVVDRDTTNPVAVHIYVNGRFAVATGTGQPRNDVVAVHPGVVTNSGYTVTIPVAPGSNQVCAYAINVGPGTGNPLLGCRQVVAP